MATAAVIMALLGSLATAIGESPANELVELLQLVTLVCGLAGVIYAIWRSSVRFALHLERLTSKDAALSHALSEHVTESIRAHRRHEDRINSLVEITTKVATVQKCDRDIIHEITRRLQDEASPKGST